MLKICPNYSVVLRGDRQGSSDILLHRARCKQWSCEYCAQVNRRIWLARIGNELERTPGAQWYMWTVTLPGHQHQGDTAQSLLYWRSRWQKWMQRVKRKLGKVRYLRVYEPHADGTLHVHILMDATYPDTVQVWEKPDVDNWRSRAAHDDLVSVGLGWRHDIRPIQPYNAEYTAFQAVCGYVAKYLTKSVQTRARDAVRGAGLNRVRMIQTSQGWAGLKGDRQSDAEWSPISAVTDVQHVRDEMRGYHWYDVDFGEYLDEWHFQGGKWPYKPLEVPSEDKR